MGPGTVVPVSYLSCWGGAGDPFVLLREQIVFADFTKEQRQMWRNIKAQYKEIKDQAEKEGWEEEDLREEVIQLVLGMDVQELMDEVAPEGHWWGQHPDGGCLGFWPNDWMED